MSSIRDSLNEGNYPISCFRWNCDAKIVADECRALLTDDLEKCLGKIKSLEKATAIPKARRGSCPACREVYDKREYPSASVSGRCQRCRYKFCPR